MGSGVRRIEPKAPAGDLFNESDVGHVAGHGAGQPGAVESNLPGEIDMRALLAIAALLLACSAVQAQYIIEYDGRTIRIDPDRGTVSIPGVYDNTGKKTKRARPHQDSQQKQEPAQPPTGERQPA